VDPQRMKGISGVVVNDPVDRAAEIVEKLRKKCDLLIALSHLEPNTEKRLLKEVPEIDILVSGGHAGKPLHKPEHRGEPVASETAAKEDSAEQVKPQGRTVTLRTANRGASLGRLDLTVAPGFVALRDSSKAGAEDKNIGYYRNTLISLDKKIEEDPQVKELITEHKNAGRKQTASGPAEKVRVYLGAARCRRCHTDQYVVWEAGSHAQAYERLVKDGHGRDSECIGCHSTGYKQRGGFWEMVRGPERLGGVQCEACHGPGSVHVEQEGKGHISKTASPKLCLACHTSERDKTFDLQVDLQLVQCPRSET